MPTNKNYAPKSKYAHPAFKLARVCPWCPLEIDQTEPLTRGLEACFVAHHSGRFVELVNGYDLIPSSYKDTEKTSVDHYGQGIRVDNPATSSYMSSAFQSAATTNHSISFFGRYESVNWARPSIGFFAQNGATTDKGFHLKGGTNKLRYQAGNGALNADATGLSYDTVYSCVGTYDSVASPESTIYVDGTAAGTATGVSNLGANDHTFHYGGYFDGGYSSRFSNTIMCVWARTLSADEVQAWDRDPFRSLLKPRL